MKELIEDYKRKIESAKELSEGLVDSKTGAIESMSAYERIRTKGGEYRAFVTALEREIKKPISVCDVWVIQVWYGESIDYFYLSEEEAKAEATKRKNDFRKHKRELHHAMTDEEFEKYFESSYKTMNYKALTLSDAMWEVKDLAVMESELNDFR